MRDQFIRKSLEKKVNWISNEQQNNQQKSLKQQIRALTNGPHDFNDLIDAVDLSLVPTVVVLMNFTIV